MLHLIIIYDFITMLYQILHLIFNIYFTAIQPMNNSFNEHCFEIEKCIFNM